MNRYLAIGLQEAGTVLHLARSGRLIIKAINPPPREGSMLVDEKGRRTCKVLEIIGPVSSPYISAQPLTDRIERITGTKLFVGEAPFRFEKERPPGHKFVPRGKERYGREKGPPRRD